MFIDLFTDLALKWFWYPLFGWAPFLIGHAVILHDISKSTEEVGIFAVIISDDSGKTLICTEQKPEFLKNVLQMNEANIELIPMFLNAILQFSKEINMLDCNDFRLANKDMKVVSYAQGDLVCTGFISVKSNSNTAREIFKRILTTFEKKFPKEIESFKLAGISTPFENYKIEMQQMIQSPFFKEAKMIDAN